MRAYITEPFYCLTRGNIISQVCLDWKVNSKLLAPNKTFTSQNNKNNTGAVYSNYRTITLY